MVRKILLGLLCIVLWAAPPAAQGEELADRVAATARIGLWKEISGGGASSAAVAVMEDGEFLYSETFGMRDRERSIPVDAHTQFNIGSVSKVFTAAAVLLLWDDGKVDLDEPVTAYLPEFTMADGRYADITVRMLLNHSSGIPGIIMKDAVGTRKYGGYIDLTLQVLSENTLKHAPGELSIYCNDALTLAEAVVERASGKSYGEFLRERIFLKAGMEDTSCYYREGNRNIILAYDRQSGGAYPTEYVNAMGSGGITSTAQDLCRFAQAVLFGGLLSQQALEEFQKPQYAPETVPEGLPVFAYGLGWDTASIEAFEDQGVRVLSKNGGTSQFTSQLYVVPEEKLAVAVTVTSNSGNVAGICDSVLQALLEQKGLVKPKNQPPALAPRPAPIPQEMLDFQGYYGMYNRIVQVRFDLEANALAYGVFDGEGFVPQALFPYGEDGFFHMNGHRLAFVEKTGIKYILLYPQDHKRCLVFAQELPQGKKEDAAGFAGKAWLPHNLSATELSCFGAVTGLIPGLEGYLFYRSEDALSGSILYMPCALAGPDSTRMCLRYASDLAEPRLVEEEGQTLLKVSGFLFTDASQAAVLAREERVTIPEDGRNVARRLPQDAVFTSTLPASGRLVVLLPDLTLAYDSLRHGAPELVVREGSYAIFIGAAGDGFQTALGQ